MTNGQHIPFSDLEKLLDGLAGKIMDEHVSAALQRARRAIFQQPPGRPQLDDRVALRQIGELIATSGMSFHSAALKVARARHPYENHKAVVERLRRKAKINSTK